MRALIQLIFGIVTLSILHAQQPNNFNPVPIPSAPNVGAQSFNEGSWNVQFTEGSVATVLALYEQITNRKVVSDPSAVGKPVSFQSMKKMNSSEAAEFIELNLRQNGFAIVPTQRADYWKLVSSTDGNVINQNFIPVIRNEYEIPRTEEVVTFITQLKHVSPDEAAEVLTQVVSLHAYGRIVGLNSSNSLIITENGSTIRRILKLLHEIDIRVQPTIDRLYSLERATAEDVVSALTEIYSNETSQTSRPPAGNTANRNNTTTGQVANNRAPSNSSGAPGINPNAPRFQAITRSNSVLVIATPDEMINIDRLIGYLDAARVESNFIRLQLNYLSVRNFLSIAGDTLSRGIGDTGQATGQPNNQQTNNRNTGNNISNNTGQGVNGSGTASASAGLSSLSEDIVGPQSLVIGKTLLVADNDHNVLIASGPPEDLFLIEELVEAMDLRPAQIQISAVVASLSLNNDFDFGVDFLRTLPNSVNGSDVAGGFRSRTTNQGGLLDVDSLSDAGQAIAGITSGLNLFGRVNSSLDTFVSTLESTNRFKVLSRPTLYTINNRRAVIQTGQRIAVPRSTLSSFDTNNQVVTANIDFENVLLRVEVVPLINNDGQITLRINQSNDDIVGSQTVGGDEIPTIGTQAIGTTVMVPDGQTVLLGGLISEGDSRGESGLPVFGNLPIVGKVLGSKADEIERDELLIFIQPKIIYSDKDYNQADCDIIRRTKVGEDAERFSEGEVDNLPSFQSKEFETPENRNYAVKNLFRRLSGKPPIKKNRP